METEITYILCSVKGIVILWKNIHFDDPPHLQVTYISFMLSHISSRGGKWGINEALIYMYVFDHSYTGHRYKNNDSDLFKVGFWLSNHIAIFLSIPYTFLYSGPWTPVSLPDQNTCHSSPFKNAITVGKYFS